MTCPFLKSCIAPLGNCVAPNTEIDDTIFVPPDYITIVSVDELAINCKLFEPKFDIGK